MPWHARDILRPMIILVLVSSALLGCKAGGNAGTAAAGQPPFMSTMATAPPQTAEEALPAEKTGGFDGQRAYVLVAKQVSFGPRPSGSPAIAKLQDFLQSELKNYGCTVEVDSFSADTPVGRLPMKNIVVKIAGEKPGVILLATHYDTKPMANFVGADDGGSSTALMLELARLLCPQRGKYAVWIAFFDGEEAMKQWSDTDSRYGSRQMAAKLAISGDRIAQFLRESSSTPALVELIWNNATKLGYSSLFLVGSSSAEDDHDSFMKRGVPAVDVIADFVNNGYWHTPEDSMAVISARTLGMVGHVFLESVKELQSK